MPEIKRTTIEWLPELASRWQIGRIKQYFDIIKDLSTEGEPDRVLKLARSGITEKDVTTNAGQMAASYAGYNKVLPGDLLLNPMDLYSGANCNVSELAGVISPAYTNLRAKNVGLVCSKYYDYYFKYQYWTMAMFAHGKGVSFDNRWTLNNDTLKVYEIPVPTYEEQVAIVEAIEGQTKKIDTLIANQEKQIEKLKAYRRSLITEVVTKGLNPDAPMKDSGVEWVSEIPQGWSVYKLKYLFEFGKGLPITKADLTESGVRVISYGQIHAKYNKSYGIVDALYRYIPGVYLDSNPQSLVRKEDFIFADTSEDVEGSGDFVRVDNDEVLFAGYHTVVLFSQRPSISKYLSFLFMASNWKQQMQSLVCGIKVYSISRKIFDKVTVVIPSQEEQEEITKFLDEKCSQIDRLIAIKQAKIEKLQTYKKSLIYEYVTGKKEVTNA